MLQLLREREMVRLRVIERVLTGLSVSAAARMLRLSPRQVFRRKARVHSLGPEGVVHGNRLNVVACPGC